MSTTALLPHVVKEHPVHVPHQVRLPGVQLYTRAMLPSPHLRPGQGHGAGEPRLASGAHVPEPSGQVLQLPRKLHRILQLLRDLARRLLHLEEVAPEAYTILPRHVEAQAVPERFEELLPQRGKKFCLSPTKASTCSLMNGTSVSNMTAFWWVYSSTLPL